jgi:hypothetical protein
MGVVKMRTVKQFQKEIIKAHDCKECRDKIICVAIDRFGRTFCAYCKEEVNYPRATLAEINSWVNNLK